MNLVGDMMFPASSLHNVRTWYCTVHAASPESLLGYESPEPSSFNYTDQLSKDTLKDKVIRKEDTL
jgi:hypothetical protein